MKRGGVAPGERALSVRGDQPRHDAVRSAEMALGVADDVGGKEGTFRFLHGVFRFALPLKRSLSSFHFPLQF